MREVGSYEAKTHLPELLKEVENGETIVITRRGAPIARLTPLDDINRSETKAVIERIKEARAQRSLVSVDEILSARDEGRRS